MRTIQFTLCYNYHYEFNTCGLIEFAGFGAFGSACLLVKHYVLTNSFFRHLNRAHDCSSKTNVTTTYFNETFHHLNKTLQESTSGCASFLASQVAEYTLLGIGIGSFLVASGLLIYRCKHIQSPQASPLLP